MLDRRNHRIVLPWLERAAWLALLLLAAGLPFELRRPWLALGPLAITNVELGLLAALALWLGALAAGRRPRFPAAVAAAAGAWLLVVVASALAAPSHRAEALKFTGRLAAGLAAGALAYDQARTLARQQQLGRALALGGLAVGVVGLAEAAGWPPVVARLDWFRAAPTAVGPLLRVSATLSYANITAMLLELTLPLALAWLLTARAAGARWLLGAGLAAGVMALVLTLSRAGVASLLAALGLMGALAAWQRSRPAARGAAALGAGLLAVLALVLAANPLTGRRLNLGSEVDWYQAEYSAPAALVLRPGAAAAVSVTVRSLSRFTWPAAGPNAVALSYHLIGPDGKRLPLEGLRTPLPADLPPGASVTLAAVVRAPNSPGSYRVAWDLVDEGVLWFSDKSGVLGASQLTVTTAAGQDSAAGQAPAAGGPAVAPPVIARSQLWSLALRMALAHPLLGVGPDNFRHTYGLYAGLDQWDDRIHSNSLYLEWLATTGVLGAAAFLYLAWRLARGALAGLRARASGPPAGLFWQLALLASLSAWFLHGLLDFFFEFTAAYLAFWLVAALALAAAAPAETA